MVAHYFCDKGQPKSGAVRFRCDKRVEQMRFDVVGNTDAIINDAKLKRQSDWRARRAMTGGCPDEMQNTILFALSLVDGFGCVFDQIEKNLRQQIFIAPHIRQRRVIIFNERNMRAKPFLASIRTFSNIA